MGDLINRKATIDSICRTVCDNPEICQSPCDEIKVLEIMPSAEPETHDKRTETHACDLIDRQVAIDAINKIFPADPMRDDYTQGITCGAALANVYVAQLPSAQPEIIRCKECKYNSNTCWNYVNCDIIPQMFGRTTDNFCSRAERRTDET